ncbi:hypothetical protein LEMLEM_LOCUS23099, partial [Lemmus lemmus]
MSQRFFLTAPPFLIILACLSFSLFLFHQSSANTLLTKFEKDCDPVTRSWHMPYCFPVMTIRKNMLKILQRSIASPPLPVCPPLPFPLPFPSSCPSLSFSCLSLPLLFHLIY